MMNKSIFALFILLALVSCIENDYKIKKYNKISDSSSLNIDVKNRIKFMESFKSICRLKNLNNEFNLIETDFKFIRQNMILSYTKREVLGLDGILKREIFIMCDVYENSDEALRNSYGYIYFENHFIMNVTKDAIYYIAWKDEEKGLKKNNDEYNYYKSELIGDHTKMVITNLDEDVIRETFNYEGQINKYKLGRVSLEYVTCEDQNCFDVVSKIYADSISYIRYLKTIE